MNEILKYTFTKDTFEVVDGELILGDPIEITAYFTMKLSGMSLFEMEYGKPLIKTLSALLTQMDSESIRELEEYAKGGDGLNETSVERLLLVADGMLDSKFIKALASASYTKIEGSIPLNTIATVQEFKESDMYELCLSDFDFIGKLLSMTVDCLNRKSKNKQTGKRKNSQ